MKRSAAIVGPTPAFLRWALKHGCSLRDLDVENLADATFKQLRGVRELSDGFRQQRVFESICVYPHQSQNVETIRGFPIDEIYDLHGDAKALDATCGNCQANALGDLPNHGMAGLPAGNNYWAGCFGMLATDLKFELGCDDPPSPSCDDSRHDLIKAFQDTAKNAGLTELNFYQMWSERWLSGEKLHASVAIFDRLAPSYPDHQPLQQFASALRRADRYQLPMFVQLIPSGISDGIHWTVGRACRRCGYQGRTQRNKGQRCPACDHDSPETPAKKAKVLGLRPFLLLKNVLGPKETEQFVQRYHTFRANVVT